MRRTLLVSLILVGVFSVQVLAEEAPPTGDETRRAKVFATVGKKQITIGELEDTIDSRSPYARQRFADPKVLKQFADDQVQNELFYQGAEKLGYGQDPDVVKFVDQTMVQLFIRKEFEEAVTPDDVPAEEVATYYKEHPDEFRRPEMRRARHILVGSKAAAEDIIKELRSGKGNTFRALAKEKSLDTETNLRGGDLLYFTKDGNLVGKEPPQAVDPTLVKAAFELQKNGDLSKPLDLGDGKWSVLELTGIRPEKVQTLEEANGAIRRKLWHAEREAALTKLMTDLREELKPEIYPERMNAIVLSPADGRSEPPKP